MPEAPKNCTISAPINNFHLLECTPGANGNLPPQLFHLEVYAYLDRRKREPSTNEQITASGEQQGSISSNEHHPLPGNQLDTPDNQYAAGEPGRPNGEWKQADGEANRMDGKQLNGHRSRPFVKIKSGEHNSNSQEANHNLDINHELNQEITSYDKASGNHKINFQDDAGKPLDYNQYEDYAPARPPAGQLLLIANYTEYSYPTFVISLVNMNLTGLNLNRLSSLDTLHLMIYSSNHKGRSGKISLDFSIGNQTSQLKHLFVQQKNGQEGSSEFCFGNFFVLFSRVLGSEKRLKIIFCLLN